MINFAILLGALHRKPNPCKLIQPNSEIVLKIRDEIFPSKDGNYTFEDSITVVTYVLRRIEYNSDGNVWKSFDHWATPEETIEKGQGDCEDFAILVCSILRSMGLDAWVVHGIDHAWVRVFSSDGLFEDYMGTTTPEFYMFNEECIIYFDD